MKGFEIGHFQLLNDIVRFFFAQNDFPYIVRKHSYFHTNRLLQVRHLRIIFKNLC